MIERIIKVLQVHAIADSKDVDCGDYIGAAYYEGYVDALHDIKLTLDKMNVRDK